MFALLMPCPRCGSAYHHFFLNFSQRQCSECHCQWRQADFHDREDWQRIRDAIVQQHNNASH